VSAKRESAAIVGVGVAACAVCCSGPILAFLAAIGLGTALGLVAFGVAGLVIALAVGLVLHRRRRRQRASSCAPAPEVVQVGPPQMRASR
jgi:mercuric ion transport protein